MGDWRRQLSILPERHEKYFDRIRSLFERHESSSRIQTWMLGIPRLAFYWLECHAAGIAREKTRLPSDQELSGRGDTLRGMGDREQPSDFILRRYQRYRGGTALAHHRQ